MLINKLINLERSQNSLGYNIYLVASNDVDNLTFEKFLDQFECDLECVASCLIDKDISFNEYCKLNRLVKRVNINKSDWMLSTCTCYGYYKAFACKAVKLKIIPMNLEFNKLNKKNKKGAKKKATPALVRM